VDTLLIDLRNALRMLIVHRAVTAIAVLTLALGIGANTTVFTMLKGIVLRPLPGVRAADELVVLLSASRSGERGPMNYLDYADVRDRSTTLAGVAGTFPVAMTLGTGDNAERVWGELVTGNLFGVLGVGPALGRLITEADDRAAGSQPVAVISYALWQRKFKGDPGVIGRSLQVGTHLLTIVGVTAREYRGSMVGLGLHVFVPLRMQADLLPMGNLIDRVERDNHWLLTVGRVKPGLGLDQARAEMKVLSDQLQSEARDEGMSDRAMLVPLSQSPYGAQAVLLPVFTVSMIMVGLVLLVACANLSNILLARATVRRQEIAVRLANGASRGRVIRQLLTESLLLSLLGGVSALLLSLWANSFFNGLEIPLQYPVVVNARIDGMVFLFTTIASAFCGIVFGLTPAWQSSRIDLAPTLVDTRSTMRFRRSWLRSGLLVGQVAMSLALIVAAALVVRSQTHVARANPGFDPAGVSLFAMDVSQSGYTPATGPALYRNVVREVAAMPGIQSASLAFQLPLMVVGMMTRGVDVDGYAPGSREDMNFGFNIVSEDYFATMRIPLTRGRAFDARDSESAPKVAIVNEPFARRYWPRQDPIGRTIRLAGNAYQVVGLVREIKYVSVTEDPRPYVYLSLAQNYTPQMTLHVRASGDASVAQGSVRSAVRRVDAALPLFDVRTLQAQTEVSLGAFDVATLFLSAAGLQALLLAAIGIYGVVAFSVAQRTREIGIRVALGATPSRVLRLIMGQGFVLAVAGVVLGTAMALASSRILVGLLYGVGPRDPLTFAGVAAGLLTVALFACWIPARRALRVNPINALRYE
jgi:macrolide transport system ATP-binding/permease protein